MLELLATLEQFNFFNALIEENVFQEVIKSKTTLFFNKRKKKKVSNLNPYLGKIIPKSGFFFLLDACNKVCDLHKLKIL